MCIGGGTWPLFTRTEPSAHMVSCIYLAWEGGGGACYHYAPAHHVHSSNTLLNI